MPHRRACFPTAAIHQIGLPEVRCPARNMQRAVAELEQVFDLFAAAIRRQPHQFAAFIPVAKNIGRGPAVERAEARQVVEFTAQEATVGLHPDLLQAFDPCAAEGVIAFGFPGEWRGGIGGRIGLDDVGLIAADTVDNHHDTIFKGRRRKRAVSVRQMMGYRHHSVGTRQVEWMSGSLGPFIFGKKARHVLIDQPLFHFRDGQDVTISNDQIDIIKRDAFRIQAIIDHFLVETCGVLFTRDPFLGDGECDGAVAQQAGAHIMVIGIQAENVGVLFGHRHSWIVGILIEKTLGRRSHVCLLKMAFAKSRLPNHVCDVTILPRHISRGHSFGRFDSFVDRRNRRSTPQYQHARRCLSRSSISADQNRLRQIYLPILIQA